MFIKKNNKYHIILAIIVAKLIAGVFYLYGFWVHVCNVHRDIDNWIRLANFHLENHLVGVCPVCLTNLIHVWAESWLKHQNIVFG